jgi:hypothetical protein
MTEQAVKPSTVLQQIETLRARASKIRQSANVMFSLLVFPAILGAIVVFFSAPEITGTDLARVEIAREQTLNDERSRLNELKFRLQERVLMEGIPEDQREALNKEIDHLNQSLNALPAIQPPSLGSTLPSLVQVNITRFGIVGVIIFGITILMGLYRNNIRLAVYFETRADALELYLTKELPDHVLGQFIESYPFVDFGKAPTIPVDQAVELTRNARNLSRSE